MAVDGGFGIYVHWPFCEAKCPYCDFNSHVTKSIDQGRWRDAYLAEIDRYAAELGGRKVDSVFFGGGTPSLMDPATVGAILDEVATCWSLADDVEVTLEANPSSVEAQRFAGYRTAGVNRVSVGVQALNDRDLKRLGRLHSVDEALAAVEVARTTFDRASFDLIYARQDQTITNWEQELQRALALGFTHMSLYQLTIEDNTTFGDRYKRGGLRGLPSDDLAADMYDRTLEICESAGLQRYEVSNFAVPGQESRHNMIYWRCRDYVGIGPGAHGRITGPNGARYAVETPLAPAVWLEAAERRSSQEAREAVSALEQGEELLLMGLRLREGVSLDRFETVTGRSLDQGRIADLKSRGILKVDRDRISVRNQYVNLLDTVIGEVLPN